MVAASVWILEYLKAGDHEDRDNTTDGDCDEGRSAERLTEFWETSDVRLAIRVLLRLSAL
jgi:hypothetical protein